MRIYANPTQYHEEDDIDPIVAEKMVQVYGENWQEVLEEQEEDAKDEEEYEFYTFGDVI